MLTLWSGNSQSGNLSWGNKLEWRKIVMSKNMFIVAILFFNCENSKANSLPQDMAIVKLIGSSNHLHIV